MNKTILVIDDDQTIRKAFTLALEDSGYQIITAESGDKALEILNKYRFDLFFLDLKMPGLNGVQTLRAIRKVYPDTPVYIVTAFHNEFLDELKEAVADGVDFEILKKPIGGSQIAEVTKSILSK